MATVPTRPQCTAVTGWLASTKEMPKPRLRWGSWQTLRSRSSIGTAALHLPLLKCRASLSPAHVADEHAGAAGEGAGAPTSSSSRVFACVCAHRFSSFFTSDGQSECCTVLPQA